jgi:hypothetical protein
MLSCSKVSAILIESAKIKITPNPEIQQFQPADTESLTSIISHE